MRVEDGGLSTSVAGALVALAPKAAMFAHLGEVLPRVQGSGLGIGFAGCRVEGGGFRDQV